MTENLHTEQYYLSAGECGPESQMPVPLIASRMIEAATHHANAIGVGYDDLIANGQAWVLSRLTIEMQRYPAINENYFVTTWVEGVNRHFSERNFEIADHSGTVIGYGRSVWVAIDIESRTVADISRFTVLSDIACDRPCRSSVRGDTGRCHRPTALPPTLSDTATSTSTVMSTRPATSNCCSTSGPSISTTLTSYTASKSATLTKPTSATRPV